MKNVWILAVSAGLLLSACKDDSTDEVPVEETVYNNGSYVVNEGGFGANNGSITHISSEGTVTPNLFNSVNSKELGDVVQSMTVVGENGFIVVNNSQKVEVVSLVDFTNTATILGFDYPRYGVNASGRLFISNGSFGGTVYEISTTTNAKIDSVSVGNGPEQMLVNGNDLLVANSGGWSTDSTISIVDMNSMTESAKVEVARTPVAMVSDANNDIWVLCKGHKEYDENWAVVGGSSPVLIKLNGSTYAVESTVEIGDFNSSVNGLAISNDGETLFYNKSGVYSLAITATSSEANPIISDSAYGLNVNAEGNIVCLIAPDFASNGSRKIYNASGDLVSSKSVGIAPNGVAFY